VNIGGEELTALSMQIHGKDVFQSRKPRRRGVPQEEAPHRKKKVERGGVRGVSLCCGKKSRMPPRRKKPYHNLGRAG